MDILKINGHDVEVNYPDELEPHMDRFENMRIRGEKLQACSPFRAERHPSFAVNLENGSWVDSGADEESERKGSFISLLAFFRGETHEETSEYLLEKYAHILDDIEGLKLDINLSMNEETFFIEQEKYKAVIDRTSEYLLRRGICAETQIWFQTGIGERGNSITIPWHDSFGRIINIKYRSTQNKNFWYTSWGQPIKNHVYGLWAVIRKGVDKVCCVESEIDALYLWSMGIPAIAFGGASINEVQKKLILNSGIQELIIATDNDAVGHRFAQVLSYEFGGILKCYRFNFPEGIKDINEMTEKEVISEMDKKTLIGLNVF